VIVMPVLQELYRYADTERYRDSRIKCLEGFPKLNARECLFNEYNVVYGEKILQDEVHNLDILSQVMKFCETSRGLVIFVTGDYMLATFSTISTLYIPKTKLIVSLEGIDSSNIKLPKSLSVGDLLYSLSISFGILG